MSEETNLVQSRRRINLSQSVKGVITWDITVENFNNNNEQAVDDIMDLKKRMEKKLNPEGGE